MKRSFYSLCFLLMLGLTVSAQVQLPLNGNFENWSEGVLLGNTYDSLDHWDTPQRLAVALSVPDTVTFPSMDASNGSMAVYMETKLVNIAGLIETEIPGTIATGKYFVNLFTQEFGTTGGQAIDCTPENITGMYKYTPVMNDTAQVLVVMTRWTGTTRDTLANDLFVLPDPTTDYTMFDFTINYTGTDAPDTVSLSFLSSGVGGVAGSNMTLDDVVLRGGDCVTGLDFINTPEAIEVAPNPATSFIGINLDIEQPMVGRVTDLAGRTLQTVQVVNGINRIDVAGLSEGMYFISVEDGTRIHYTGKFEKF